MSTTVQPLPTTSHTTLLPTDDPKYCRTCYPEFEIPNLDAHNARLTGIWLPFVDPVYGNRMQVHATADEVAVCAEREAGVRFVQAVLGSEEGVVIGSRL